MKLQSPRARTKTKMERRSKIGKKELEDRTRRRAACAKLICNRPEPMPPVVATIVRLETAFLATPGEMWTCRGTSSDFDMCKLKERLSGSKINTAFKCLVWRPDPRICLTVAKKGRVTVSGGFGFSEVEEVVANAQLQLEAALPGISTYSSDESSTVEVSLVQFDLQHSVDLRGLADDPIDGVHCEFEPEIQACAIYRIPSAGVSANVFASGSVSLFNAKSEEDVRACCYLISEVMAGYCQ